MRIVQIGPFPLEKSLIRGGVEASVFGLSIEQAKSSTVHVIDFPRMNIKDSVEELELLTVHRFINPGPHQKDSTQRVKGIVNVIIGLKPDICHLHGTGVFSWALYKELRKASIPTISTVHGLVSVEKKKALKQHFSIKLLYQLIVQSYCEKRLLSAQSSVIVDTEYVAEAVKSFHLSKMPRIAIIPQGINEKFFEIDCSESSRIILSVGSISKRKGHHLLIQAFSIAAERMKDIELVICGVLTDKSYFNELQTLVASAPCNKRITIKANLHKDELLEQYSKAHVFALHTQEESQGIVFAEAMATGLPIVSTSVGGVPFVVSDGITGFLSNYGDVNAFSQSLLKILSLDHDWGTMSFNCKKASRAYSWSTTAKMIEAEYIMVKES